MKEFCSGVLLSCALLGVVSAEEQPVTNIPSCLIVAHYGTEGAFFYRDQYGVPLDQLQLAYNGDELRTVMKKGIKVVVYDVKEHESFAEARQSCFFSAQAASSSK
jgi:hypothetical protein